MLDHNEATDYTDIEAVRAEVREARRVFAEHHWPVIDVTGARSRRRRRRSISSCCAAMAATAERIILASASLARAGLLRSAGVDFTGEPAAIDESRLKRAARRRGESATSCAIALATEKACVVSRRYPEALVIGADQILAIGTEWFDKPADLAEAYAQRGRCAGGPTGLRPPRGCPRRGSLVARDAGA